MDRCNGGMVLNLAENHCFLLKLGCGSGSNTRAELLALYELLQFAYMKNFLSLQICGNSRVIVD